MSLNKVMIIGNAGKDPEVVAFQDGSRMAKLTLAATEKYTDRNGQRQQQTEWFNVVINGKSVDVAEKYVRKGSQIYVEGKLRTRKYQAQDGSERYVTEVLCQSLQLLGSAPQGQQQQAAPQPYPQQGYAQQPQPQPYPPQGYAQQQQPQPMPQAPVQQPPQPQQFQQQQQPYPPQAYAPKQDYAPAPADGDLPF